MAYIDIQYDPAWAAFKAAHPGPAATDAEIADQQKMDQFLKDLYDPSSPSYHQYVGDARTAFPGVQQRIQDMMAWDQNVIDLFTKQYGHNPILSTNVYGPRGSSSYPTPDAGSGNPNAKLITNSFDPITGEYIGNATNKDTTNTPDSNPLQAKATGTGYTPTGMATIPDNLTTSTPTNYNANTPLSTLMSNLEAQTAQLRGSSVWNPNYSNFWQNMNYSDY